MAIVVQDWDTPENLAYKNSMDHLSAAEKNILSQLDNDQQEALVALANPELDWQMRFKRGMALPDWVLAISLKKYKHDPKHSLPALIMKEHKIKRTEH